MIRKVTIEKVIGWNAGVFTMKKDAGLVLKAIEVDGDVIQRGWL